MTTSLPEVNYYNEFVDFKKKYSGIVFTDLPKIDKIFDMHIIKYLKLDDEEEKKYYGKYYLIEKYLNKKYKKNYRRKYYNLKYNIIRYFPKKKILKWLETDFESREICYIPLLHIELVKFMFNIWYTEDTEFRLHVKKIETHLIDTVNMSPEEYHDILKNKKNPKFNPQKNYIYYTFWLYPYFVLFDNCEELIMKLIDLVNLDDAQEDLLYGIYQMSPDMLAPFMKKILTKLWQQNNGMVKNVSEQCFDYFSGCEILLILRKLYKYGYNLINDPEVRELFKYKTPDGIEKNDLDDRLDEVYDIMSDELKMDEEYKLDKIYAEYFENENHIDEDSGIVMRVRIRKVIRSRFNVLRMFDIDSHIKSAEKFIKENREIILKNFDSSSMSLPLMKNRTILLNIKIKKTVDQNIIQEYLIFPFEKSGFNTCISSTHKVNDVGKYVEFGASCFAYRRFNFSIDNIANQHMAANSQWILSELIDDNAEHVCDICNAFITKGDFRCDVCKDFDICSNCKEVFETDTNEQKEIKDKLDHSTNHTLSQKFIGRWDCEKYDNYLCFPIFSSDILLL